MSGSSSTLLIPTLNFIIKLKVNTLIRESEYEIHSGILLVWVETQAQDPQLGVLVEQINSQTERQAELSLKVQLLLLIDHIRIL